MGIDPGLAITGYGVLEEKNSETRRLASGVIRTSKQTPGEQRLAQIYDRVGELILEYRPQTLAIEKLFFCKNVRTALQVGEARGTVILAAAKGELEFYEYTPLQVKQAVAGYGRADKQQVQRMVELVLKLPEKLKVDDEADALAVALCHLQYRSFNRATRGGRGR